MFKLNFAEKNFEISISKNFINGVGNFLNNYSWLIILYSLLVISLISFTTYYFNGLGLAYNDARSHLDIGRRVVEGLKPGFAQLGSVWLPLPHILMLPTIWSDFMWHTGFSGALVSMISFVGTGVLIYRFLQKLGANLLARFVGVFVFASNTNILYLQSTAMTELLLIATMTAAAYDLLLWHQNNKLLHLIKSAFWVMLATLVRYDGWFLFLFIVGLIVLKIAKGSSKFFSAETFKKIEGTIILYSTLAALGIFLWLLWNLLIFKDPFYFAFGPYSARAQQEQLEHAGILATKGDILLSSKLYLYALLFNTGVFTALLGLFGALALWFDKRIKPSVRLATTALTAPLIFNILALFLGHSVLFIQGVSGDTWFNVRYGIMMVPSIAIFIGYLVYRLKNLKVAIIALLLFVTFFQFSSYDAVTIDDARVGSSQKNVTEVSGWLNRNAKERPGFVLISAASHDAIIFSSGLPMKKFIHEGTGKYWESATTSPDRWARWIIMRTHDDNDSTYKAVSKTPGFARYNLIEKYPFADIYELKPEYLNELNTKPSLGKQK